MRYVVDITQKQAEEIESFIKKGKYNSFAQFITTAVENQIYIENGEIGEEKLESKNKRINYERYDLGEDEVHLLKRLLCKDPRYRIELDDIMETAWFKTE